MFGKAKMRASDLRVDMKSTHRGNYTAGEDRSWECQGGIKHEDKVLSNQSNFLNTGMGF